MARVDVLQSTVLDRLLDLLRTSLGLEEANCYESISPPGDVAIPVGGDYWVVLTPGPSQFHELEQAPVQTMEFWTVQITVYSRVKLDRAGHDQFMLRDAARGLYPIKRTILKALVGQDVAMEDGSTFLRQWLYCKGCSAPQALQNRNITSEGIAYLTLEFGVDFDWDLTTE